LFLVLEKMTRLAKNKDEALKIINGQNIVLNVLPLPDEPDLNHDSKND